jgi:hypothetical protein
MSEQICMGRLDCTETKAFIEHLQKCGSCRQIHENNLGWTAAIRGTESMLRLGKGVTHRMTLVIKF